MTAQYIENPVLFINSTSGAVPKGRNVRAQSRSQEAHVIAPPKEQKGHFIVLDLNAKSAVGADKPAPRKRRKTHNHGSEITKMDSLTNLSHRLRGANEIHLDPRNILPLATFHVRRIAAMTVRADPSRLSEILRCRQWSCVPYSGMILGRSRCLDSSLSCVAAKLRQITGGTTSTLHVLSLYSEALRELQEALQSPSQYDHRDLLMATQLLAVYEMLDSLETATWDKHVAGASSLVKPENGISHFEDYGTTLTLAEVAPVFTDALLSCNGDALSSHPWQSVFQLVLDQPGLASNFRRLISCLLHLLKLLDDSKALRHSREAPNPSQIYELLDRAHILKDQLRKAVLASDPTSACGYKAVESFDGLGMGLAALIAIDRLIESLRPADLPAKEGFKDDTSELCAQLLQLELGAADGAYPAADLMSAFRMSTFQEQAGYVIVLPGGDAL